MYEAKLGSNPNYIWRCIWGTLYAGARIRIGTGESVNAWRDPWVPDAHNPYVETIPVEGLEFRKYNCQHAKICRRIELG